MPDQQHNSFEKIYEVVRCIPRGRVATYGQVAALAGNRRWSRVVGFALHVNPDPEGIPCYRVVNRLGEVASAFAFGGENRQIALLEADGIPCPGGRVDLSVYRWRPEMDLYPEIDMHPEADGHLKTDGRLDRGGLSKADERSGQECRNGRAMSAYDLERALREDAPRLSLGEVP